MKLREIKHRNVAKQVIETSESEAESEGLHSFMHSFTHTRDTPIYAIYT